MRDYIDDGTPIVIEPKLSLIMNNDVLAAVALKCSYLIALYSAIEMSLRQLLLYATKASDEDLNAFIYGYYKQKEFNSKLNQKIKSTMKNDYDLFKKALDDFDKLTRARTKIAHCVWASWERPNDEIVFIEKNQYHNLMAHGLTNNGIVTDTKKIEEIISNIVSGISVANKNDIDDLLSMGANVLNIFTKLRDKINIY